MSESFEDLLCKLGVENQYYSSSYIEQRLKNEMALLGLTSTNTYWDFIQKNPDTRNRLMHLFENHYTDFFRDGVVFTLLEKKVFPAIIERKQKEQAKSVRVWSAACSSGQEAYSISMIWDELRTSRNPDLTCFLFATDKNEFQLEKARKGAYLEQSMSRVSFERVHRYFSKKEGLYVVNDALKSGIDFSVFDLLTRQDCCPASSIYGNFDLIFCCNVLCYYASEYQNRIVRLLDHSMAENAFLVVDSSERDLLLRKGFLEFIPESGIFVKHENTRNYGP